MSCPKCGSDDFKFASLVHAEGTSHVNEKTRGAGVGIGLGGVGIGLGGSSTKGIHQSQLARNNAPPSEELTPLVITVGVIIAGGGWLIGSWWGWLSVVVFAFVPMVYRYESPRFDAAMMQYQKTCVCQRCGMQYIRN